uniref:Small ribosomal subunit protein uS17 N-terminal domain-containing protein n=2 Tax=cellular organisms TaxID=131567 RepID=A0A8C6CTX0_MOSMO
MADIQTERAYQKQPTIFQNKKRVLLGETGKEKLPRYYKNIGLGFKTPKEAIEGTYIDKKCPFTGNVSIRGRILSGVVTKMKMQRTIVIRRDYLHYIRKYNRFEKRHKNMSVHLSPCFRTPWLQCGGHQLLGRVVKGVLSHRPSEPPLPCERHDRWRSSVPGRVGASSAWPEPSTWFVLSNYLGQVKLQGRPDRRHRHGGRVPAPEQDRALQRPQGHQGCWHQEAVPEVLSLGLCLPPQTQ